jgi:hypothetical protein
MTKRKVFWYGCTAVMVALLSTFAIHAEDAAKVNAVRDVLAFDEIEGGQWNPSPDRALTLLQWDDGTFETGLGVNINAAYDGQMGMRFGGYPLTTGLVPMQIRGAYWRFYPGFGGATNININFWHPLGATPPQFPTGAAPILQVPGVPNTTLTQFASVSAGIGPTISTANGSVLVGVGILGQGSWFLAGDTTAPAGRQYFGGATSSTLVWDYGAASLTGYGFALNFLIRLYVDGNIPVELQTISVE